MIICDWILELRSLKVEYSLKCFGGNIVGVGGLPDSELWGVKRAGGGFE